MYCLLNIHGILKYGRLSLAFKPKGNGIVGLSPDIMLRDWSLNLSPLRSYMEMT